MKMNSKGILRPVNKEEMQELFTVTAETLATNVDMHKNNFSNAFNAIDLWKMRKTQKSAIAQRRFF